MQETTKINLAYYINSLHRLQVQDFTFSSQIIMILQASYLSLLDLKERANCMYCQMVSPSIPKPKETQICHGDLCLLHVSPYFIFDFDIITSGQRILTSDCMAAGIFSWENLM